MNTTTTASTTSRPRIKAWVDPQVTRHSLYLGQTKPVQLHADRLALLVQPQGATAARVPLPRIDRIISGPLANWSGTALIACAEAGIPVVFAANPQQACASLAPILQTSGRLDAELTLFSEAPNAEAAWQDGLRALRSRLLCELWRDTQRTPEGPLWEEQRRSFVYQGGQPARRMAAPDARCYAVVAAQLHQQGLQLRYPTRAGKWLELALDLAAALHDWRALSAPLEQQARTSMRLRAETFETSAAAQTDTVSWCLLILRRCAHEHIKPWL